MIIGNKYSDLASEKQYGMEWWTGSGGHSSQMLPPRNSGLGFVRAARISVIMDISSVQFSSVQSLSRVRLFVTPWIAARQASLSITNSWSSLRLTHVHQVSDAIQPSHPLSSPSPPAPNPSQHQSLFQWVNSSQEMAKYWSFSFSIIPSKEIPGLISFRMDWLDLLAVLAQAIN